MSRDRDDDTGPEYRGTVSPCGCVWGYWNPSREVELCAAHAGNVPVVAPCAEGCDKRDAENCRRASWSVQCGCACHPEAPPVDAHQAIEDRLIRRDLEDLYEREALRK